MFLFQDSKVLFMHIPKCAGKTIRTAFNPDDFEAGYWHWRFVSEMDQWADWAHPTLDVLKGLPQWELIENNTVIAIIRDPVTRFFSSLREHCKAHNVSDPSVLLSELDEIRIAHDPRYIHFCPQHRFTHIGPKRHVDYLARVENLHEDLRAIGIKCRFAHSFFDAIDRIPVERFDDEIDPSLRELFMQLILRLYSRDFLLFGYPMPDFDFNKAQEESEFSRLLIDPLALAEWDGNIAAGEAYARFNSVRQLKIAKEDLESRLEETLSLLHSANSSTDDLQQQLKMVKEDLENRLVEAACQLDSANSSIEDLHRRIEEVQQRPSNPRRQSARIRASRAVRSYIKGLLRK
jgi:Sulfotransferase family